MIKIPKVSGTYDEKQLPGVLDQTVHARLYQDIDNIAHQAGILKHWIWSPLSDVCSEAEIEWIIGFKKHAPNRNKLGLVLSGTPEPAIELRMSAMAGALLRNFIRAEVSTVQRVIDRVDKADVPDATALLIPNLYSGKGTLPPWKIALLLDGLMQRGYDGKMTIVHVSDKNAFAADYGKDIAGFLSQNYDHVDF